MNQYFQDQMNRNTITINLCGLFSTIGNTRSISIPMQKTCSLKEIIENLDSSRLTGLKNACIDESNKIRDSIYILLNGNVVIDGLNAPVEPGSTLTFMIAISGG